MVKKILIGVVSLIILLGISTFLIFNKIIPINQNKGSIPESQVLSKNKTYINLSTPEKALESYIRCLQNGDREGAIQCLGGGGFYLTKPVPINSYIITQKIVYTKSQIDELITKNQMPEPPFQVGDIRFEVKEIYKAGESEGPISYEDGQEEMFTYWLRKINDKWIIISHSAWNQD